MDSISTLEELHFRLQSVYYLLVVFIFDQLRTNTAPPPSLFSVVLCCVGFWVHSHPFFISRVRPSVCPSVLFRGFYHTSSPFPLLHNKEERKEKRGRKKEYQTEIRPVLHPEVGTAAAGAQSPPEDPPYPKRAPRLAAGVEDHGRSNSGAEPATDVGDGDDA